MAYQPCHSRSLFIVTSTQAELIQSVAIIIWLHVLNSDDSEMCLKKVCNCSDFILQWFGLPWQTQPLTLSVMRNQYQPKCCDDVQLGSV